MQTVPFAQARAQLAEVLRSVEAGETAVVISRRGQPSGVVMSFGEYQQLNGNAHGFVDRLNTWRSNCLAAACTPDEADPFDGVRQPDATRPPPW